MKESLNIAVKELTVAPSPLLDRRIGMLIETHPRAAARRSDGLLSHALLIKSLAAAVLLVAGLLSTMTLYKKSSPAAYSLRQTVKALGAVRSVQMAVVNDPARSRITMLINPETGRADYVRRQSQETGDVTITIPGQTYAFVKAKNEVTLASKDVSGSSLNFRDFVNSLIYQTRSKGPRIVIFKGYNDLAGTDVVTVSIVRKNKTLAGRLLIDPETKLPIFIAIDSNGQLIYYGPIEYDAKIDDKDFEFVIPEGASVIDTRPEELKNAQRMETQTPDSQKKTTPYGRFGRVSFPD